MNTDRDVLLVSMPFGHVFSPSIGLSLLKAELAADGVSAHVRYFSIRFAELVGQAFYYGVAAEDRPPMMGLPGEWIFSAALFGCNRERDAKYVEEVLRMRGSSANRHWDTAASPALIDRILRARGKVDAFLQECLEEVVALRPKLVGFTSLFQQHVASLALARLVKQALPETFVVFGGANCEGVMGAETVRQFRFVDAAVSGEADLIFTELVRRVLEGRSASGLPGVRTREGVETEFSEGRFSTAPPVRDLDALPYPDCDDYFRDFERSKFGETWQPSLFIETARGCWWGEKMHCTFCGLNGETMAFRSKSARRAMDELVWLTDRRPECAVDVTDNILDMRYFKDFVPALAARRPKVELYYEVKANLKKEQVRMLRDAGIRRIQPGIESFSDPILKQMRKGVSALQNVQLLKWCKELGVRPAWNIIWGFPGEPPEEYNRMTRLVPLLTHLPPPDAFGPIRLDRFSPNFDDAERLGFTDVAPLPSYKHVYALPPEALKNLACYFEFGYREPRDVGGYAAPLEKELRSWQRRAEENELFSVDTGQHLLVWDLRGARRAPLTVLGGIDRILYQHCDSACDLQRLAEGASRSGHEALGPEAVARRLELLLDHGLLLKDGSRYLALAIPLGEYSPGPRAIGCFYRLLGTIGKRVAAGWIVSARAAHAGSRRPAGPRDARSHRLKTSRRRLGGRLTATQFSCNGDGEVRVQRLCGS